MRHVVLSRIARCRLTPALAIAAVTVLTASCGGSATTSMTSPTSINRCAITMRGVDGPLPAEGGSATIAVTAARECAWSASVEGTWLSIRAGTTGQGDGTVEISANANPDPQMRRGALNANGQRTEISQSAGTCEIVLAQSSAAFNQGGGTGQVNVRASSSMCSWSAAADADWIQITTPTGQGSGPVTFAVPPSTDPPRSATITVAGQKFSVTQSEGCTYSIAPASQSIPAAGGNGVIALSTTPTCPWTALSNAPWLTVGPSSGQGPASVTFSVMPTTGKSRSGTAIVGGQPFVVSQSDGCSYLVQPPSAQIGAAGGTVSIGVNASRECEWSAVSNDSWITFQGRSGGSGDGSVVLAIAPTSGPARSGTATVGGQRVTITQAPGCSFSIAPESANAPPAGSTGKITVTAGAGCSWAASSNASWLTLSSGATGSGTGEVSYTVAATTGPARSAAITIGGRTFTLNQGEGCTVTLSAPSATISDDGGQGSFTLQTGAGCGWTATATAPWLTISSGASGSGDGVVRFTAAKNIGPARSAAITAGGQTFTVSQGDGCSISLSPSSFPAPAAGGTGSIAVTAGGGCSWTATSNASWISITSGTTGTGNGTVALTVAGNTAAARQGTVTIGGRTVTVSQGEACTFAISPDQVSVPAAAGSTNVAVTSSAGCAWTSSSGAPWLSISAGDSGTGSGTVAIAIQANTGAARSGTATIAGHPFIVNQGSGCAFAISPPSQTVPASGGTVTVTVAGSAGCGWTTSTQTPWLTISSGGTGTGSGPVQVDVQPNPGPSRTGTVTIGGQTFTVLQDPGCSYVVSPENVSVPAAGGTARVDIATAASCAWQAMSTAGWISITGPAAGAGNGGLELSFAANAGPVRSSAVTVGGRTVAVTQESGCTFGLSATSQAMPASGGVGTVAVSTSAGCTWSAVSGASWIRIDSGGSGSGGGNVQFAVEPNATGAPRSGTLTIANLAFTLNQQ